MPPDYPITDLWMECPRFDAELAGFGFVAVPSSVKLASAWYLVIPGSFGEAGSPMRAWSGPGAGPGARCGPDAGSNQV